MIKITNACAVVLMICLFTNCISNGKPENFDYGSVRDHVYINKFFKCKIKFPKDWVIQSREQTEELADRGKDLVAGEDKQLQSMVKASEVNTANLLAVFQHEVGADVAYNPSIVLVAENVSYAPGIKDGSDYLYQSRKFLKQSQFQYDYISEAFEKEVINGTDFYRMDTSMNYAALEIKQAFYATIKNGFSFNVIISYVDDDQKNLLMKTVNSLTFRK